MNNRLGDCHAQAGHSLRQPVGHATSMKREIGHARTFHAWDCISETGRRSIAILLRSFDRFLSVPCNSPARSPVNAFVCLLTAEDAEVFAEGRRGCHSMIARGC